MNPLIQNIDLSRVEKLLRRDGHSEEEIQESLAEYKKFLVSCLEEDGKHEPNKLADYSWHSHILDTKNYTKDCQTIFGRYLHHFPYVDKISKVNCDGQCAKSCCSNHLNGSKECKECGKSCKGCTTDVKKAKKDCGGDCESSNCRHCASDKKKECINDDGNMGDGCSDTI